MRRCARIRGCGTGRTCAWVFTVAHRKAIDHVRAVAALGARRRRPGDPDPRAIPREQPDEGLWSLVRELPTKQRTALALRYVADAGYDEISTVMGTSEDAARRNVHEALKRLRPEYRP